VDSLGEVLRARAGNKDKKKSDEAITQGGSLF
jgi:hypothetical protein